MSFIYDLTKLQEDSAAGRLARVRLLCTDCVNTSDQPAIFADEELNTFLDLKDDDVYEAGAMAYETWARSRGRIALIMQRDGFTSQRHAIQHLLAAAENLRNAQLRGTLQTASINASANDFLHDWRDEEAGNALDDGSVYVVEG